MTLPEIVRLPSRAIPAAHSELRSGDLYSGDTVDRVRRWVAASCEELDILELNRLPDVVLRSLSLDTSLSPYYAVAPSRSDSDGSSAVHAFVFNRSAEMFEIYGPFDPAAHAPSYLPTSLPDYFAEHAADVRIRPWTGAAEQQPAVRQVLNAFSHIISWLHRHRRLEGESMLQRITHSERNPL